MRSGDEVPVAEPPLRSDRRWWLIVVACTLPIVANAVRAASIGWVPTFDTAFTHVRVLDVGGSATPLVGVPSTLGGSAAHPGPLQMWLLAPVTRLFGWTPLALMIAQATLNAAWIAVCLVVTRVASVRVSLMASAGGAIALAATLGTELGHDPWNPHAAVVPCTVALWCAAVALTDGHRAAWLAVLAGSMAAQAHLTFTLPGAFAGLAALAGCIVAVHRSAPGARRSLAITVGVGVFAWSGPLLREITGPSNLAALFGSGDGEDRLGWRTATDRLVWFLRPDGILLDRDLATDDLIRRATVVSGLVVVVALGAVAFGAWRVRHRRPELAALGGVALVALAVVWVMTAIMPATLATLFGVNTMRCFGPPALLVWIAAVALVADAVAERRPSAADRARRLVPGALGLALVVVTVAAVAFDASSERDGAWFDVTAASAAAVPDTLADEPLTFVTVGVPLESSIGSGVFADLVRRGFDIVAEGPVSAGLVHPSRLADPDDRRAQLALIVVTAADAPPSSPGEVARIDRIVEDRALTIVILTSPAT